jgi:predicted DNA-binding protein (MmcQ/YjbR family)
VSVEWFREHCLSLPHATEQVQWGNDLVFKIGGKMFAVMTLEPPGHPFSFKCTPEKYAELLEVSGIIPAPYMARAQWVSFERPDVLPRAEIKDLVRVAYDLVFAKLTKKAQAELSLSL